MKNIFFTHIKLYIATKKNIWCLWVKTLLVLTNNHSIKKRNQLILRALAYTWQSPVLFLSQGLAISWKIRCLLKLKFPSEFEKSDSFCCVFVLFFFPPSLKMVLLSNKDCTLGQSKLKYEVFWKQCPCPFEFHNKESRSPMVKLYAHGSNSSNFCILLLGLGCWQREVGNSAWVRSSVSEPTRR